MSAFCGSTDQMATLRSSNLKRANYRAKCRQKLSEHIHKIRPFSRGMSSANRVEATKLGILIKLADVRLIISANNSYIWHPLAEKEYLFKNYLSKRFIGAYRELCRGVGVSFEVVPVPNSNAMERRVLEER